MTKDKFKFVISRTYPVSRLTLWKLWTNNEELKKWFGPKGNPIFSSTLELKTNGIYHYGMQNSDGDIMWGKWVFKEIIPLKKLVFVVSFCDKNKKSIHHPADHDWPLEILSTISFIDHGNETEVIVQCESCNATEIQEKAFKNGNSSMTKGWAGTFEQLTTYLKTKTAN